MRTRLEAVGSKADMRPIGLSDRAGVQRAVLELHIENAKLVARAIDPFTVGEAKHIIVPTAADHPVAALQKSVVQRLLLMRTGALDAAKARADAQHQDAIVAETRLRLE